MGSKYDFDSVIDRKNTSSLKYDFGMRRQGREDLLPLWVADMDFQLPSEVLEDIQKVVSHGIFGYTDPKEDYFEAVQGWYKRQFDWETKREWIIVTPGVVFALAQAIRAFTKEGESVLIQQPVYYPFSECIVDNNRKLVNNQLHYENGRYTVDFEDFEKKIVENQVKIFLLCNPHNPVGRVWDEEELRRMGDICLAHDVLVISDEIHGDFVYRKKHYVYAELGEEYRKNSIICTAPSKTFNIAGLQMSNIFIPNQGLRRRFRREVRNVGYSQINTIGLAATKSVYTKGHEWYTELKEYLWDNYLFAKQFIEERIPNIRVVEPEGTYLLWLDCSGLGLSATELENLILNKAKLWLDSGVIFGKETALFQRINYACPRSVLEQGLVQLEAALKE
ncbi:MalY/PatB family protein [Konateibacter massiliensis]|uniref:MalY/PatB family protein n=1 Tax=Konateibacter massiliensis TaxID=2002841 RepID=UPI000C14C3E6|nr:MalY/PatB family protein [Konateibacter massiliensis]